jgi:hypothetical protein
MKKEVEKAKRDARRLDKKTLSGKNVEVAGAISHMDERTGEDGLVSSDSS